MLIMIDNYCSFTYNQVHYFGDLSVDLHVYRNDRITLAELEKLKPTALIISSGPCTPTEAGISLAAIQQFAGKIPLFGICLGLQSIGQTFGGKIIRAKQAMHGKLSKIYHEGRGVFKNLPNPFQAVRYHSLVVEQQTLPDCLEVTAWTENSNGEREEIMGLQHRQWLIEGVQFHPESILTEQGHALLKNFLKEAKLL